MSKWKQVSDFVNFSIKGITPKYVENSSIIVLNQKCIRNGKIDYSLSQFTDDTKQISETKFVKRGDILINSTGTGTAGRCAFVKELPENHRLITDSHILLLRCNSYHEAQCLSYLLFSFEKTLMSFMTGSSGQSELDKVVLLNLKTKLPTDSNTQQKIVKVLSDLDTKIVINNHINTELEAMTKMLYDYWFVQFDFPDDNGKPYKTSGGKMVWNAELKREIPERWEVKTIDKFADFKNGKGINKEYLTDRGKFAVYGSNGIVGRTDQVLFSEPVIAIGRVGANYGEVHYSLDMCWVSDNSITSQPVKKEYFWWLIHILKSVNYSNIAGGSAQPLITQGQLRALPIAISNNALIEDFHEKFNSSYLQLNKNLKENQELASLRDWLLPMLMNGQVSVGDFAEELGMVAEESARYGK